MVAEYQANLQLLEATVFREFIDKVPDCQTGGVRYRHFLYAFSGKDLLLAMDPNLRQMGFASAAVFLEKVLLAIEGSTDNLGDWIGEWRALQNLVMSV